MRIDRADSESELLGAPSSSAEIVKVVAGDFEVRLAQTAAEIECLLEISAPVVSGDECAHGQPDAGGDLRVRR